MRVSSHGELDLRSNRRYRRFMRRSPAPVTPIFRTETQAQLLARLYLRPDKQWTLASLARELGISASTVHAEVHRLEEAELVTADQIGRSRVLHANHQHPLYRPIADILAYAYGPRAVIADEFGHLRGVSRLLIFGSWAARHLGQPGGAPHDIDVLVVGDADRGMVYAAADRAQDRIGMPVNAVLASNRRWDGDADALIRQVKSSPTIDLTDEIRPSEPAPETS
jgi:hypothetical protein